jgi:hypothetical protein
MGRVPSNFNKIILIYVNSQTKTKCRFFIIIARFSSLHLTTALSTPDGCLPVGDCLVPLISAPLRNFIPKFNARALLQKQPQLPPPIRNAIVIVGPSFIVCRTKELKSN